MVAARGFILSQSDYPSASSSCGLCLSPVSLFTTWSAPLPLPSQRGTVVSASCVQSTIFLSGKQAGKQASELTSHTRRRRRRRPTLSAAHDSLAHMRQRHALSARPSVYLLCLPACLCLAALLGAAWAGLRRRRSPATRRATWTATTTATHR